MGIKIEYKEKKELVDSVTLEVGDTFLYCGKTYLRISHNGFHVDKYNEFDEESKIHPNVIRLDDCKLFDFEPCQVEKIECKLIEL